MKVAVIFVALIATCAAMDVTHLMQMGAKVQHMYEKCVKNISSTAMYNLMMWGGLEDKETNCARACLMTQCHTMADNKINMIEIEQKMNSCPWMASHPQIKNTMVQVAKGCQKIADTGANECEVAGKWNVCYRTIVENLFVAVYTAIKAVIDAAAKAGA